LNRKLTLIQVKKTLLFEGRNSLYQTKQMLTILVVVRNEPEHTKH